MEKLGGLFLWGEAIGAGWLGCRYQAESGVGNFDMRPHVVLVNPKIENNYISKKKKLENWSSLRTWSIFRNPLRGFGGLMSSCLLWQVIKGLFFE